MTGHVHAALMAEYAKDAAETDTPWKQWEIKERVTNYWKGLLSQPTWEPDRVYRRKRTPLCQVEGRDVFPGDKLWHTCDGWVTVTKQGCTSDHICADETKHLLSRLLSWSEPPRTKTIYNWVARRADGRWFIPDYLYSTEEELREQHVVEVVRRLDHTAIEVPV